MIQIKGKYVFTHAHIKCTLIVTYYLFCTISIAHLNDTFIISVHMSALERTRSVSLLCEIMRPLT